MPALPGYSLPILSQARRGTDNCEKVRSRAVTFLHRVPPVMNGRLWCINKECPDTLLFFIDSHPGR
jgi:hypothetical protein